RDVALPHEKSDHGVAQDCPRSHGDAHATAAQPVLRPHPRRDVRAIARDSVRVPRHRRLLAARVGLKKFVTVTLPVALATAVVLVGAREVWVCVTWDRARV